MYVNKRVLLTWLDFCYFNWSYLFIYLKDRSCWPVERFVDCMCIRFLYAFVRCTLCTKSSFPCTWCVEGHQCTSNKELCQSDVLVTGKHVRDHREALHKLQRKSLDEFRACRRLHGQRFLLVSTDLFMLRLCLHCFSFVVPINSSADTQSFITASVEMRSPTAFSLDSSILLGCMESFISHIFSDAVCIRKQLREKRIRVSGVIWGGGGGGVGG